MITVIQTSWRSIKRKESKRKKDKMLYFTVGLFEWRCDNGLVGKTISDRERKKRMIYCKQMNM